MVNHSFLLSLSLPVYTTRLLVFNLDLALGSSENLKSIMDLPFLEKCEFKYRHNISHKIVGEEVLQFQIKIPDPEAHKVASSSDRTVI